VSAPGVIENLVVDQWLFSRLDGDVALRGILSAPVGGTRIGNRVVPAGWAREVVVIFNEQAPMVDARGVGSGRVMAAGLWSLRVIGRPENDLATMHAAARRVDELLDGQSGTVAGSHVLSCVRRETLRFQDSDGFLNLDQLYSFQVS
jgi:hypothetical protein